MDFRTTSIRKRAAGLTLTEMMVATGIGAVVTAAVATLVAYSGRSFAAMANYVSLDRTSRNALDSMSREIRQTKRLLSSTTTSLTFEDFDGATLAYAYNSDAKTMVRSRNSVADTKPLLTECDYLEFSTFQRNPIGGSYGVYPTASPSTCKMVQLTWICSRQVFGMKLNTESVQSSKIVIRKQ